MSKYFRKYCIQEMSNQYYQSFDRYAKMGVVCDTSGRELIDNTKFFQPYDPLYDIVPTVMYQYPGYNACECPDENQKSTDIPKEKIPKYYRRSCCGGK